MTILPKDLIPADLWDGNILRMSGPLHSSYLSQLNRLGLTAACQDGIDRKDVHGGATADETHEHFAHRFAVSSGRLQYSVLSPCNSLDEISDAFLSSFSDGSIALLDIPCGAGAASGALIGTLIRLREEKVLPTLPLTISVCAGDYSVEALAIFDALLQDLVEPAHRQAIALSWCTVKWDAMRGDSSANLVDKWFANSVEATEHFVVVSNFSGTLQNNVAFQKFSPCLESILSRLHDKVSSLVWIEPATNDAKKTVFKRLVDLFVSRINWFRSHKSPSSTYEAEFKVGHPLTGSAFRSTVSVLRFIRT